MTPTPPRIKRSLGSPGILTCYGHIGELGPSMNEIGSILRLGSRVNLMSTRGSWPIVVENMVENMLKLRAGTARNRRIMRSARDRTLILQALLVLGLLPSPEAVADRTVSIATLIPYAAKAEVRDSIRQDCGLSSKLSKLDVARSIRNGRPMLRVGNPNSEEARGAPETAPFLDLRITDAIETSGGLLPTLSLSIDGVLKQDGRVVGTFVGTRFARAGFIPFRRGECAILSEAVRLLAKDVVKWMKNPQLDARLGDAR